jgi:hypothetical protein
MRCAMVADFLTIIETNIICLILIIIQGRQVLKKASYKVMNESTKICNRIDSNRKPKACHPLENMMGRLTAEQAV